MLSLWYLSELNSEGTSGKNLKLGPDCVMDQDLGDLKTSTIWQGSENHKGPIRSALTPETKVSESDIKISNF